MVMATTQLRVLESLQSRPSRASAAAIGHHFVLNGVPSSLRLRGLDALAQMVCDWTSALFEQAIDDPTRGHDVRLYAIAKLGDVLMSAVDKGYWGVTKFECLLMMRRAQATLRRQERHGVHAKIDEVEDMCDHLSEAVADGVFGTMPDF